MDVEPIDMSKYQCKVNSMNYYRTYQRQPEHSLVHTKEIYIYIIWWVKKKYTHMLIYFSIEFNKKLLF